MTTAELINKIILKLGGNYVTFVRVDKRQVVFKWGGNEYIAICNYDSKNIAVRRCEHGSAIYSTNDYYPQWIEGVLNDKQRTESGEFTDAETKN